jgi:hypothetical protein
MNAKLKVKNTDLIPSGMLPEKSKLISEKKKKRDFAQNYG